MSEPLTSPEPKGTEGSVGSAGGLRKSRLAFVTTHFIPYQVPLFRKLARHPQIDFHVYVWSTRGLDPYQDSETRVPIDWGIPLTDGYPFTILSGFNNIWSLMKSWLRLWQELGREHYDALVVPAYGSPYAWLTFFVGLLTRTPMIASGHSILYPRPWWKRLTKGMLLPLMFRKMEAFLPHSTLSAELYIHYGVPRDRIFLFPFAVDNDYFKEQHRVYQPLQSQLRQSLGLAQNGVVVLFVGKLVERKRPLDVMQAIESLPCRDQISLIFVGDGKLRKTLEEYATKRGLRNVMFVGFRKQAELPQFYAIADIFVLPSEEDPWGAVINEAMCFKLPVVTTDAVGAAKDILHHGENGFIYPVGDIHALSEVLRTLIANPALRQKMGQRSFAIISAWNYDRCIDALLNALETTWSQKRCCHVQPSTRSS